MSGHRTIALLGRRDAPTDAIEEYCQYLGAALSAQGFALEIARVAWLADGWPAAMRELEHQAKEWRGCWVLVQYTALSWSERGFPLRFLRVLRILRQAGARVAMVYHDVLPYPGNRTIDKLRRRAQNHAMSEALRSCDLSVFTVPVSKISWIEKKPRGPFLFLWARICRNRKALGKCHMKRRTGCRRLLCLVLPAGKPASGRSRAFPRLCKLWLSVWESCGSS